MIIELAVTSESIDTVSVQPLSVYPQ